MISQNILANEQFSTIAIDVSEIGSTNQIKRFCKQLGQALTVAPVIHQKGLWTKFNCKKSGLKKAPWILQIVPDDEKGLALTLKNTKESANAPSSTWYEEDHVSSPLEADDQRIWILFMAMRVAQNAPALLPLTADDMTKITTEKNILKLKLNLPQQMTTKLKESFVRSFVPKKITLYRLTQSENDVWLPVVIGEGTINKKVLQNPKRTRYLSEASDGDWLSWQIRFLEPYTPKKDEIVYVHSTKGVNFFKTEQKWTSKALKSSKENILKTFVNRLQLGLRGGGSMVRSSPLLKKTKMFGLLLESKAGWSDGLRVYYDVTPRAKNTDENDQMSSFYSSRVVGGWSFEASVADFTADIIDAVDLTPKLGGWTFDASLPVLFDDGSFNSRGFEVARAFSLGVEVGITSIFSDVQTRLWYGGDFAGLFSKQLGATKVSQNRYGIDAYVPIYGGTEGSDSLIVSLLLFAYGETIYLQKIQAATDELGGPSEIDSLTISNAFMGLGIVISP